MHLFLRHVKNIHSVLFDKYLLLTNTFICGFGAGVSDITAQKLENLIIEKQFVGINWNRTMKFSGIALIMGPTVHFWYRWLDKIIPGNSLKIVCTKSLIDGFSFSPAYICAFYLIEKSFNKAENKSGLLGLNINGFKYWVFETALASPLQIFNFRFLPLKYRVVFDNFVSYWFDTVFAYFFNKEDS